MEEHEEPLAEAVGQRERRKIRRREEREKGIWFGLGMFGLVGWSVALPTLAFLALGIWVDGQYESRFSWTLMLLVVGVALGCFNAWYWIQTEHRRGNGVDESKTPP